VETDSVGSREQRSDLAAREVIEGKLDQQLTRASSPTRTQINLSFTGVIGHRADELFGAELGSKNPVQQNDRVDMRQPSKGWFPTATPLTLGQQSSDHAAGLASGTKRPTLAVTELTLPENPPDCAILSLLTYCMMHSIQQLADSVRSFAEHFVKVTLRESMQRSLLMVTARAPKIGCDNAAKMTQSKRARGTMLKEKAVPLGFVPGADFDRHVQPAKMKRAG
jgi:fumarate hydratase class II